MFKNTDSDAYEFASNFHNKKIKSIAYKFKKKSNEYNNRYYCSNAKKKYTINPTKKIKKKNKKTDKTNDILSILNINKKYIIREVTNSLVTLVINKFDSKYKEKISYLVTFVFSEILNSANISVPSISKIIFFIKIGKKIYKCIVNMQAKIDNLYLIENKKDYEEYENFIKHNPKILEKFKTME